MGKGGWNERKITNAKIEPLKFPDVVRYMRHSIAMDLAGSRQAFAVRKKRSKKGKSSPPSPMPAPEASRWTATKTLKLKSGFYFSTGESNPRTLSIYDEAPSDLPPIPLS